MAAHFSLVTAKPLRQCSLISSRINFRPYHCSARSPWFTSTSLQPHRRRTFTSHGKHDNSQPSPADEKSKKVDEGISMEHQHDWEDNPRYQKWRDMENYTDLPHANFGVNQHMVIQTEFKQALKGIMWQFPPSMYAFAYGSGVFPQSSGSAVSEEQARTVHPKPNPAILKAQRGAPKMIDFILGVSHSQHWHSLNLREHKDHYSFMASLPFANSIIPAVQDNWGSGVYFNPYVTVNGTMIKYGIVNIDTLCRDLTEWDTLYLAGRLHKPVKILRDNPQVRLANQMNLLSALRTSLLLLPSKFTERDLYNTIASISYLGDPRMAFPTENPKKVSNIVGHNMENFRTLYKPLIDTLPNVCFINSSAASSSGGENNGLDQDMDPVKRGNMVRRLPNAFRKKLYFQYQRKFAIPQKEFDAMMEENADEDGINARRREGGRFERRIATDDAQELRRVVRDVIKATVKWPSTTQSLKGPFTAGPVNTMRYLREKMAKYQEGS